MPRSSDGAYSLPPGTLVASGDTLLPTQHNPAMQDIAQALSNSLDRNGAGGLRAPLDMGGYAVRNAQPGVLPTDLATVGQSGVPVGVFFPFAGSVAPSNYVLCYGQALSRTEYPILFAAIGTAFGSGDGTTTFNVPDMRGNAAVGKDDMGGPAAGRLNGAIVIGGQTGSQTATLSIDQLPAHNHSISDPGHTHTFGNAVQAGGASLDSGAGYQLVNGQTATAATGISVNNAGGGQGHANVQPSLVTNYIIKVAL